ncbi:MAG: RNA ligase family protein [Enterococcus sp.]|nr:RNA ligase family protein [Enterococcus sp.]
MKYPRTMHLPSSLGATNDDKYTSSEALKNLSSGIELIVTEKMDGGNLTMTRNHFFARSLDSGTHSWDTQAKALWAMVRWDIPEGWRISGESLTARRSVGYENLPDVYLVFGIWDETNTLLDWDSTMEFSALLGLTTVPLLYRGTNYNKALNIWSETKNREISEGFVMRNAGKIPYNRFHLEVAKWVRANHVTTSAGWRGRDDWESNGFATSRGKHLPKG